MGQRINIFEADSLGMYEIKFNRDQYELVRLLKGRWNGSLTCKSDLNYPPFSNLYDSFNLEISENNHKLYANINSSLLESCWELELSAIGNAIIEINGIEPKYNGKLKISFIQMNNETYMGSLEYFISDSRVGAGNGSLTKSHLQYTNVTNESVIQNVNTSENIDDLSLDAIENEIEQEILRDSKEKIGVIRQLKELFGFGISVGLIIAIITFIISILILASIYKVPIIPIGIVCFFLYRIYKKKHNK